MSPFPPRPDRKLASPPEPEGFDVDVPEPSLPPPPPLPAEADESTRSRLIDAMLKAAAAELGPGKVKISSVPPKAGDEPPRSSIRVAAKATGKWALKGVTLSGAVTLAASAIALWKPEYKMPIAQAFKLFGSLFTALGNALGGEPSDAP